MKATILPLMITTLFVATVTCAQEPRAPQYVHLQDLEPFIGRWEGPFDPPGEVPAGTCHVVATWIGYKSYVHFKVTFTPDNTEIVLNPHNVFVGFNGRTQATHAWHLNSVSQASTPTTIAEGKLVMEGGEGFSVQGKPHSRTTTYELRSADELVVTSTNIKYDGNDVPDEDVLVLKRVKASDAR